MPSLLRLADHDWPCSRADLERDNPATWFPPNLEDAQPLSDFGYALPDPTDPPEHDPVAFEAREVRPIQGEDGTWQQAWELVALPPPPEPEPQPDWAQFRQALRQENGYGSAFQSALAADPMAGVQLAIGLDRFRREGDYADFLEALGNSLSVLPTDQAAHIALELLALAGRCNLPLSFREALQAMFEQ